MSQAPAEGALAAAQATATAAAPSVETELVIEELSTPRKTWRLVLFPPGLRLSPTSLEPPLHVAREAFAGAASLDERRKRLLLKRPQRHVFQLDDAAFAALQAWLGPALLLKVALRARLVAAVPIGAFWMITSVPLGCEKTLGMERMPVDWFGLAMGVALFVMGFAGQARPHRAFFLLDSAWCLALVGQVIVRMARGTDGPFWTIFVVWCLAAVYAGVRSFLRFGRTTA